MKLHIILALVGSKKNTLINLGKLTAVNLNMDRKDVTENLSND